MKPSINTTSLTIGYGRGKTQKEILSNLELNLYPGELTALIGANGTGKSTLLKTLSGNLHKLAGSIVFGDRPIESFSKLELAQYRSIVTTERHEIDHLTVLDLVSMGRHPYTSWMGKLSEIDLDAVERSIRVTGLTQLQDKEISKLSDGERQKAFVARALAQSTKVIILDEPTAFLDLPNKIQLMSLLKKIANEEGKSILVSTHDLDIALSLADKLWLMGRTGIRPGVTEDLILQGAMQSIFNEKNFYFDGSSGKFSFAFEKSRYANVAGEETAKFWLSRALERKGYYVNVDVQSKIHIECKKESDRYKWVLNIGGVDGQHDTIQSLLSALDSKELKN
ncbi:MAG TPA: ABC transporter ATP-binding protein [Cytophagaceae bacterium]